MFVLKKQIFRQFSESNIYQNLSCEWSYFDFAFTSNIMCRSRGRKIKHVSWRGSVFSTCYAHWHFCLCGLFIENSGKLYFRGIVSANLNQDATCWSQNDANHEILLQRSHWCKHWSNCCHLKTIKSFPANNFPASCKTFCIQKPLKCFCIKTCLLAR